MTEEIYLVNRERPYNPFAELSHANFVMLTNAKNQQSGCFYESMASIIMSAFSFEGFLNLIGNKLDQSFWGKIERKWSYKRKLDFILNKINITEDLDSRPYKTLKTLFYFRNDIAHPKPAILKEENKIEKGEKEEIRRKYPKLEWENNCTLDFANVAYDDVYQIAKGAYGVGLCLFRLFICGNRSTKAINPESAFKTPWCSLCHAMGVVNLGGFKIYLT